MKNMQLCCFVIILCKSLGWKSLKINDWNQVWRLTENSHYLWLHCFPLVLYIGTVKLNKIIFFPRTYSLNSIQTLLFMWLVHPTRSTLRILFMSSWLGISNSFVFRLKDCVCVCVRACERAHAHAYNPVTKAVVTDTQGLTDRRWLKNASGCIRGSIATVWAVCSGSIKLILRSPHQKIRYCPLSLQDKASSCYSEHCRVGHDHLHFTSPSLV